MKILLQVYLLSSDNVHVSLNNIHTHISGSYIDSPKYIYKMYCFKSNLKYVNKKSILTFDHPTKNVPFLFLKNHIQHYLMNNHSDSFHRPVKLSQIFLDIYNLLLVFYEVVQEVVSDELHVD